jgi:hypothetical protein
MVAALVQTKTILTLCSTEQHPTAIHEKARRQNAFDCLT